MSKKPEFEKAGSFELRDINTLTSKRDLVSEVSKVHIELFKLLIELDVPVEVATSLMLQQINIGKYQAAAYHTLVKKGLLPKEEQYGHNELGASVEEQVIANSIVAAHREAFGEDEVASCNA